MEEAPHEEVEKIFGDEMTKIKKKKVLNAIQVPLIAIYNIGLNKRSSGNKCDSISGHGLLIGGNS